MASSSKKKTTFAKMTRENNVREKRLRKQARKDERKQAAAIERENPSEASDVEVEGVVDDEVTAAPGS